MTDAIRKCPFCKSDNVKVSKIFFTGSDIRKRTGSYYYVCCNNCEAGGPVAKTSKAATEWWNEVKTNDYCGKI